MELILREDVQNLGFKDDIVSVKNGYGRNYLIPQGLASMATSSARKVLAENLKQRAHKEKKIVGEANKLADALKQLEIKLSAKTAGGDNYLDLFLILICLRLLKNRDKLLIENSSPFLVALSNALEFTLLRFVCTGK